MKFGQENEEKRKEFFGLMGLGGKKGLTCPECFYCRDAISLRGRIVASSQTREESAAWLIPKGREVLYGLG